MKAVVIAEKEMGVYLGSFWSMGFWSKLDPVGQPSATCFKDEAEAREHIDSWDYQDERREFTFHEVEVTEIEGTCMYASIESCVRAGLSAWITEESPVANAMPS